jgi:hypothetical protein
MKSLLLWAVLGLAAVGGLMLTPAESQAFPRRWALGGYASYYYPAYYYAPTYYYLSGYYGYRYAPPVVVGSYYPSYTYYPAPSYYPAYGYYSGYRTYYYPGHRSYYYGPPAYYYP